MQGLGIIVEPQGVPRGTKGEYLGSPDPMDPPPEFSIPKGVEEGDEFSMPATFCLKPGGQIQLVGIKGWNYDAPETEEVVEGEEVVKEPNEETVLREKLAKADKELNGRTY